MRVRQHRAQHGNRLRFVIFNADKNFAWLQNMRKNANTLYDLSRAILNQTVIGGNVRLALSSVDNQRFNLISAALQFNACRESRTTQPGNTKLMNALD